MDKAEKLKVQEIIIDFLKHTFNEKAILRELSRVHVYECKKANSTMTSSEVVDTAQKLGKAQPMLEITEETMLKVIQSMAQRSPLIFNGRNYITADKDQDTAIQRLHGIYKKRDINLFEVEFYKDYWIVYD